ncbi:MAG: hypothetical protein DLM73_17370 [Chthoniobacterales bacterium]|nr:MAG: hypothetical protein DLM73_17370 [Chthoniobacterales bacterium]
MKRWIGRWENEGGAIMQQNTKSGISSARNARERSARHDRAADKIMKQNDHHEEMIRYGDPLMSGSRRRRGGYPVATYNDRSPEVAAMSAHLRSSSYPERAEEERSNERRRLTSHDGLVRNRMRSFLHLGRQYDTQARDNFISEAVFFVLIIAASVWPIIHTVQAMVATW